MSPRTWVTHLSPYGASWTASTGIGVAHSSALGIWLAIIASLTCLAHAWTKSCLPLRAIADQAVRLREKGFSPAETIDLFNVVHPRADAEGP